MMEIVLLTKLLDLFVNCSWIRFHWKCSYGSMAFGETRYRLESNSSLHCWMSSRTILSWYLDSMFALTSYFLSHL